MVKTAIEVSKDWLSTAEMSSKMGLYEQSLYAMEMSVEIAFKAVLRSLSIEFPKVHDITDAAREYLSGNGKLPGGFREGLQDYIATFNSLLGYRPIVGYGFDERFQNVDFEEKAKRLLPKSKEVVLACEAAIKKMRR